MRKKLKNTGSTLLLRFAGGFISGIALPFAAKESRTGIIFDLFS